jgi:hypothetical protein
MGDGLFVPPVVNINGTVVAMFSGLDADLPAANTVRPGTLYIATDTQVMYQQIDSIWVVVITGVSGSTPSLQTVLGIGNSADIDAVFTNNTDTVLTISGKGEQIEFSETVGGTVPLLISSIGASSGPLIQLKSNALQDLQTAIFGNLIALFGITDPVSYIELLTNGTGVGSVGIIQLSRKTGIGAISTLQLRPISGFASNRVISFPDDDGTVALQGDLAQYFKLPHITQGGGPNPSVTLGAGAGSGSTVTIGSNSSDTAGTVTVVTAGVSAANGVLFTLNFGTAFSNKPILIISPANAATQAQALAAKPFYDYSGSSTAAATIRNGTIAPTAGLTLFWTYHTMEG